MHCTHGRVGYQPIERPGDLTLKFGALVLCNCSCSQKNEKQRTQE
jgi:hypothetical protein